jgi:nicotinamidase-related amidase
MKRVTMLVLGVLLVAAVTVSAGEEAKAPAPTMKPALLIIDIQNGYLPYMSEQDRRMAIEMINAAIGMFRQNGHPVIRVYHTSPGWGPQPGEEGFEFPKSVQVLPDDPKVVKNYPSAFKKTELEALLREKGVNTLFLTGLSATACVLATYHGAVERDFATFMVKDAVMSGDTEQTRVIEQISETVGFGALEVMLQNAAR